MASSRGDLSPLQRELLEAFFRYEQRFVLTGGSALAGFHLHHRTSQDLDLFGKPPADLASAQQALLSAAADIGATASAQRSFVEFRRFVVERGDESTLIDLVIDRTPDVDPSKVVFGAVRVDSLREIAANKLCALVGRSEIRDLIDLQALLGAGIGLPQALDDARQKDAGVDPGTLAWLLDELVIGREAELPGGVDPGELDRFRRELVVTLRKLAFPG